MNKSVIFIGFGSIGQRHYSNLLDVDKNIKVKTYIGENKKEITKRPNNKLSFKNIEVIFNKNQLRTELELLVDGDIVLICNKSSDHSFYLEFVNSNVKKDVLIIVEKPLATKFSELKKISYLSNNSNIFVISQFRCSPVFSEIKKFIKKKNYGDLVSFSLINHEAIQNWHPWEDFRDSYSTKKSFGGGCLLTQIHDLEILYGLLGLPEKAHFFFGDGKNLNIDVDDYYLASFIFRNERDIFGSITSSYYSNVKPRIHYFTFENAFISWNLNQDTLDINHNRDMNLKSFSRNKLFLNMARQMIYVSEDLKRNNEPKIQNNSGLIPIKDAFIFNEWLLSII